MFSNYFNLAICFFSLIFYFSIACTFGLKANKSSPALSILTGFANCQSFFQSYFVLIYVLFGSVSCTFEFNDRKQLSTSFWYLTLSLSSIQLSMNWTVNVVNGLAKSNCGLENKYFLQCLELEDSHLCPILGCWQSTMKEIIRGGHLFESELLLCLLKSEYKKRNYVSIFFFFCKKETCVSYIVFYSDNLYRTGRLPFDL